MRSNPLWCAIAILASVVPAAAFAVPIEYRANFTELNNSGVSGTATLVLRQDDNALDVTINATGLVPDQPHPQHIHGRFNAAGEAINSVNPVFPDDDLDGDGFIELVEALDDYGPVIVPLTSPPGGDLADFPTAPGGTISFTETYDLSLGTTFAPGFGVDDLLPLNLREIVLHGAVAPPGDPNVSQFPQTGPSGSAAPKYIAALPVASAEIFRVSSVPEPATIWLLLIGFAATTVGLRRRARAFRPSV